MSSGCICINSGFCERHNKYKTEDVYQLCKTNRNIFLHFEVEAGIITEPTILEKAGNLAVATTEHITDGLVNVSEKEQQRRIGICESCPLYNKESETCRLCGCYMKTKTAWRSGKCPDTPPRW